MKNTKGITLIALVITIIVLLILAGISISMLAGDNSILSKSTLAKNQTDESSLKEETQILLSGRLIEKKTTGTNAKTLQDELKEKMNNVDEMTTLTGPDVAYYLKRENSELTVYENGEIVDGKVEIWDGSTVECPEFKNVNNVWNWYIYKPSQLKFLANFENDENADGINIPESLASIVEEAGYKVSDIKMSTDTTIYLMNNLDLGARQTNGTKTVGSDWTPIGTDVDIIKDNFGTFEGNNFTIRGVYVKRDADYNGIFGISNTIQNLTIKDSYIKGTSGIGGISGVIYGNVKNCVNKNTIVEGAQTVGGITGLLNGSIADGCTNYGTVNGTAYYTGGLFGATSATVTNCNNNEKVVGKKTVGGIVGFALSNALIKDCSNTENIKGDGFIGGIVGNMKKNTTVIRCNNSGKIDGNEEKIGGIVGQTSYASNISECKNSGDITGSASYTGGIVGIIATDSKDPSEQTIPTVKKCINYGNIKGVICCGGIVGTACQYGAEIEQCYNLGEVEGTDKYIGGITGGLARSAKTINCYNVKRVKGNSKVGGIVGYTYSSTTEIKNCYNIGEVIGDSNLGGILGYNLGSFRTINSYYLTGTAPLDVGTGTATNLAKDKTYITTTFVTTANAEETIWSVNSEVNEGWPILKK